MVAVLLVLFMTRISRNLRSRDDYVAELRQRAAEEDIDRPHGPVRQRRGA